MMKIELRTWGEFFQIDDGIRFSSIERAKQAARQILEEKPEVKGVTLLQDGRIISRFTAI